MCKALSHVNISPVEFRGVPGRWSGRPGIDHIKHSWIHGIRRVRNP